ncbi:hypothetical protein MKMG_01783 [Methanogenium sp. MK-MG]|nr:hypothetical protein MKMG_01783 [Methanogenium sp. MK-MG]
MESQIIISAAFTAAQPGITHLIIGKLAVRCAEHIAYRHQVHSTVIKEVKSAVDENGRI